MTIDLTDLRNVEANLNHVIRGKEDVVRRVIAALLCRGHLLFEDIPGTGKTMLAKSIARSFEGLYRRIQFTPDLLPGDITGGSVYSQKTGEFEFFSGPIFSNFLLADEINRATPRTQSALLEGMEERQATIDGATYRLHDVFFVIATQNPIEQQGTFPLPEAQLDRFFMRLTLGYPERDAELSILDIRADRSPLEDLKPVMSLDALMAIQSSVESVSVSPSLKNYILAIAARTRSHPDIELGISTRGVLALRRAAQASALLSGRDYVVPDDVKEFCPPVCAHRLLVRPAVRISGVSDTNLLKGILEEVPVPVELDAAGA